MLVREMLEKGRVIDIECCMYIKKKNTKLKRIRNNIEKEKIKLC